MVGQQESRNDCKVPPPPLARGLDVVLLAADGFGLESVCVCTVCNVSVCVRLCAWVYFLGSGNRLSKGGRGQRGVKRRRMREEGTG